MANNILTGRKGEEDAAGFLRAKGYRVLERNWRSGHREIDIVAMDGKTLVFVEVKTRRWIGNERYDELVSPAKQRSLLLAGNAYRIQHGCRGDYRFDVLFVIGEGPGKEIQHIENAFDSWG